MVTIHTLIDSNTFHPPIAGNPLSAAEIFGLEQSENYTEVESSNALDEECFDKGFEFYRTKSHIYTCFCGGGPSTCKKIPTRTHQRKRIVASALALFTWNMKLWNNRPTIPIINISRTLLELHLTRARFISQSSYNIRHPQPPFHPLTTLTPSHPPASLTTLL